MRRLLVVSSRSALALLVSGVGAAAQCELQDIDSVPAWIAPAVVMDRNLALVANQPGSELVIASFSHEHGGTLDEADDTWSADGTFQPAFHFLGKLALWHDLMLARGPGELEGEGEVSVFLRRDGGWIELENLRPPPSGWRDGFGMGLAVRCGTLLIGSPTDTFSSVEYSGSAGFYERDEHGTSDPLDDTWIETERVIGIPVDRGGFGLDVALDEDLAAVAAGAAFPFASTGAVCLYVRRPMSPTTPLDDGWDQIARFVSPNIMIFPTDAFGHDVALSRDFLFVSAPAANAGQGAVYIRARLEQGVAGDLGDDAWVPLPALMASEPQPGNPRGGELALSGNRLLVAWPLAEGTSGLVELYRRLDLGVRGDPTDDQWELQSVLRPPVVGPDQYFGEHVALQGNTALVASRGHVHVFATTCPDALTGPRTRVR